jgi:hypothetical protein
MAAALRILLWALVLIAPGGILLAPLLAAHELRRRNRARAVSTAGAPNRVSQAPVRASQAPVRVSQAPASLLA